MGGVAGEEAEAQGEAVVSFGRDQRDVASTFFNLRTRCRAAGGGRAPRGQLGSICPAGREAAGGAGRERAGPVGMERRRGVGRVKGAGFAGPPPPGPSLVGTPLSCSPLTQSLTQGPP